MQGNIVPPFHCVYKIHGVRMTPSKRRGSRCLANTLQPPSIVENEYLDTSSLEQLPSNSSLDSHSGDETPVSSKLSSCDSLDSELVRSAMEHLDLDEDEEDFEDEGITEDLEDGFTEELYRVTVADFETGLNYKIDDVRVRRRQLPRQLSCQLRSEQLTFTSEAAFKGQLADRILIEQMGPSFVDQGLVVFKGRVAFKYQDQLCYPVSVNGSQWCL